MPSRLPRLIFGLCFVAAVWASGPATADEGPELTSPDALIVTSHLSRLPQAILSVPLLHDLLSEDFLFYYQTSEGFLGMKGALRRISFEHDLDLGDRLLAYLLDTPAEIALWKGKDGKLDEYLVVVNQSGLKELAELVAKASLDDKQLSAKEGASGTYVLHYAGNRELYLTVGESQLFLYSNPKLKLPVPSETESWSERLSRFFGTARSVGVLARLFGLPAGTSEHTLALSLPYLSFGYQRFFPELKALRFDYAKAGWKTSWLVQNEKRAWPLETAGLWKALPKSPALCVALPIDETTVAPLLAAALPDEASDARELAKAVRSSVAACWYAKSALYAPLFVARLGDGAVKKDFLRRAFEKLVGGTLAVKATEKAGGVEWTREVTSRYGLEEASAEAKTAGMKSKHAFSVSLAVWKRHLIFSADARLVEDAIAVLDKRYPSISDSLVDKSAALVAYPTELAALGKKSVDDSLPASQESVFRAAVSEFLFPAFERIEESPGYSLGQPHVAEGKTARWAEAKWRKLRGGE